MKLDRFRAPALAATAVLMISGAASAFAASPAPRASVTTVPVAQPAAGLAAESAEANDTDTLQEGDQTTPDVAGATEASAERPEAAGNEAPEGAGIEEAPGAETDGPGGHADPDGVNADHQFEGEE